MMAARAAKARGFRLWSEYFLSQVKGGCAHGIVQSAGGFGEGRPVCTLHPKGHSSLRFHFFPLEVETRNEAGARACASIVVRTVRCAVRQPTGVRAMCCLRRIQCPSSSAVTLRARGGFGSKSRRWAARAAQRTVRTTMVGGPPSAQSGRCAHRAQRALPPSFPFFPSRSGNEKRSGRARRCTLPFGKGGGGRGGF